MRYRSGVTCYFPPFLHSKAAKFVFPHSDDEGVNTGLTVGGGEDKVPADDAPPTVPFLFIYIATAPPKALPVREDVPAYQC